jgi:NADPH:quinone reductase-like Zn-dependent oxidoreductase
VKAVVHDRYGPPPVLRVDDVERPSPADDEVLIRVRAATVNRTDCAIRAGRPLVSRLGYSYLTTGNPFAAFLRPPQRILGSEFAGVVEETGASVAGFEVGQEVFGVNAGRMGAHAEFVCVKEAGPVAPMPNGATCEEAAAVSDWVILALNCLRLADLGPRRRILVYGASGSIGTAAVQLARYDDADVTAVCGPKNVDLVRSLGADRVIDYTKEDFLRGGERYDAILDAVGKQPFLRCRGSLLPGGVYLPTDGLLNPLHTVWTSRVGDRRVRFKIPPRYTKDDVLFLKGLMEAGRYRAVVDRVYPLEQVIEATAYVETGQKAGNVVLTLA